MNSKDIHYISNQLSTNPVSMQILIHGGGGGAKYQLSLLVVWKDLCF